MLEYVGEDVVIADSDDELIDGLAFLDGMIEFGDLAAQESAEELKAKLLEAGASGDVQEMVRIAALLKKKQKKEGDQESRFQVSGGRSFLRWIQKTTGDGFIAHFRRLIEEATAEMSIADTRHFDPATGEKVARIRPAELIEKDVDILFAFALRRTAAGVGIHFIDGTATVYDPKKNKNLAVKFTGAGKDLLNQNVRIRKKLKESGYPPSPQPQYLDMPVPAPFKS